MLLLHYVPNLAWLEAILATRCVDGRVGMQPLPACCSSNKWSGTPHRGFNSVHSSEFTALKVLLKAGEAISFRGM